jgi:hypothetical protein
MIPGFACVSILSGFNQYFYMQCVGGKASSTVAAVEETTCVMVCAFCYHETISCGLSSEDSLPVICFQRMNLFSVHSSQLIRMNAKPE